MLNSIGSGWGGEETTGVMPDPVDDDDVTDDMTSLSQKDQVSVKD